jgi:hypothetical protein
MASGLAKIPHPVDAHSELCVEHPSTRSTRVLNESKAAYAEKPEQLCNTGPWMAGERRGDVQIVES